MPAVTFLTAAGKTIVADAEIGQSLLSVALASDVEDILGECGGSLACGTCHVYIAAHFCDRLPPISTDEQTMLDFASDPRPNSRLCCQIRMSAELDGLVLHVAAQQP